MKDSSFYTNDSLLSSIANKHCDDFKEIILTNNTISYCNTDGYISNQTCPNGQIWDEDYSQCVAAWSMYRSHIFFCSGQIPTRIKSSETQVSVLLDPSINYPSAFHIPTCYWHRIYIYNQKNYYDFLVC